ncbi:carbohydrate ABC transporter permease [Bacillaceae bacterium SIJ1]|uniref:carbohydrate ABC transporter permease n=1 Tax=Litoribacterium kuwaitense TaxID=1398745 RepID=UPI0013ECADA5|nr:carbohydrate ABC transporter permease [Litoribacterium kuwaitense]NGP43827.1 carbohydrate ABC transporter permease [Litoribacterium kuwaitense]
MSKIARSRSDKLFDAINYTLLTLILLVVIYPLYLIVISSVSDPTAVNAGKVLFWPAGFTLKGYEILLDNSEVWRGYLNTLLYVVLSLILNVSLVITAGYALSRKDLIGRNFFMFLIVFTMFFSGGLIPSYLLVQQLDMINTIWAVVIPSAVSAFHLIVAKTFFQTTIPNELLEAAKVDGCSTTKFFFKIVIPLSVPIIAVMALFSAVNEWNSFFPALIYLQDQELYPLQLILRSILVASQDAAAVTGDAIDPELIAEQQQYKELIKYSLIIVSSVPILVLYPFVQRYFVKGVMIGSIKG